MQPNIPRLQAVERDGGRLLPLRRNISPEFVAALMGALAIVFYLALSILTATTKQPELDEAYFSHASFHLHSAGVLASDLRAAEGTFRAGADQHFFWQPPLFMVLTACWTGLIGAGVMTARSLSIIMGIGALSGAYLIARKLAARDPALSQTQAFLAPLLAALLISTDYFFVTVAAGGRMDMACVSLGVLAIAAYLTMRERALGAALMVSHSLVALSGLMHPNGVFWFCNLCLVAIIFDRKRITISGIAIAALPYVVAAGAWGTYITADPAEFWIQFTGNMQESGRSNYLHRHPLTVPLQAFQLEIAGRWLPAFGLGPGSAMLNRLKGLVLFCYVAAAALAMLIPSIRRSRSVRPVLLLAGCTFLLMTFTVGNKMFYYLAHIVWLGDVLIAFVLCHLWHRGAAARGAVCTACAGLIALQAGGLTFVIRQDTYHRLYAPVIRALEGRSAGNSLIMGPGELFYGLYGKRTLLDDLTLGYRNRKVPDVIAVNSFYEETFEGHRHRDPALFAHVRRLLDREYECFYSNRAYRLHARRPERSGER